MDRMRDELADSFAKTIADETDKLADQLAKLIKTVDKATADLPAQIDRRIASTRQEPPTHRDQRPANARHPGTPHPADATEADAANGEAPPATLANIAPTPNDKRRASVAPAAATLNLRGLRNEDDDDADDDDDDDDTEQTLEIQTVDETWHAYVSSGPLGMNALLSAIEREWPAPDKRTHAAMWRHYTTHFEELKKWLGQLAKMRRPEAAFLQDGQRMLWCLRATVAHHEGMADYTDLKNQIDARQRGRKDIFLEFVKGAAPPRKDTARASSARRSTSAKKRGGATSASPPSGNAPRRD
jgi:hypothetical protein